LFELLNSVFCFLFSVARDDAPSESGIRRPPGSDGASPYDPKARPSAEPQNIELGKEFIQEFRSCRSSGVAEFEIADQALEWKTENRKQEPEWERGNEICRL
jgi:hypothetical protein